MYQIKNQQQKYIKKQFFRIHVWDTKTSKPKDSKKWFLNIYMYQIRKPVAKTHQETIFTVTQMLQRAKHKACFIPTMISVAIKSKRQTTPYLGWQKMTFDNSEKQPFPSPIHGARNNLFLLRFTARNTKKLRRSKWVCENPNGNAH